MKGRKHFIFVFGLALLVGGCGLKTTPSLDPESRLFLSQVRYIITPKEKKEFLSLKTPQERKRFMEEFWKARDPDPSTPENEFKEAYMKRLRMADKLFREGSVPGWETDRGMVYILLGPPSERYAQPVANLPNYKGYEIWVYESRGFRVVFVDKIGTGHYEILWDMASAAFIDALNSASEAFKKYGRVGIFNFTLKPRVAKDSLVLEILLPFKKLNYIKENGKYHAKIRVKVSGKAGGEKIEISKNYKLTLEKNELSPLELKLPLRAGEYELEVKVEDLVGGASSAKKIKFNLKEE